MDNQPNWPSDQSNQNHIGQVANPQAVSSTVHPASQNQPIQPPPIPTATSVPSTEPVTLSPHRPTVASVVTETAGDVHQRIVQDEQIKSVKQVRRTYKLENAVGVLFGIIESSLAIRLVFKLLGANAANAFVNLLYQFTGIFANPFVGIFGHNPVFGNFELDLASVIAMIIYALVGFAAIQLARLF